MPRLTNNSVHSLHRLRHLQPVQVDVLHVVHIGCAVVAAVSVPRRPLPVRLGLVRQRLCLALKLNGISQTALALQGG